MPLRELERLKAVNRFLRLEINKDAELKKLDSKIKLVIDQVSLTNDNSSYYK